MKIKFLFHISFSLLAYFLADALTPIEEWPVGLLTIFFSAFLIIWVATYLLNRSYFSFLSSCFNLLFFFLKELIIANFRIIYFIIMPGHRFRPAILELPLELKSDSGITLLANLITLTPGTVTLDVSEDKKSLYFHIVDVPNGDIDLAKQKIKGGFEKRIKRIGI